MSDAQLEKMTQAVNAEATGLKGLTPAIDDPCAFTIELNNGRTLNEFLPKNVKFLADKEEPYYSPRQNAVHFNPELLRDHNYKAAFAHECGHALVKNPKKTNLTFLETGHEILYGARFRGLSLKERLGKIHSLMQQDLENEIDAMNNGKIVADLLGVDSMVYEDLATNAMQTHYWFTILYIGKLFEMTCPELSDDVVVDYYNPFAQESQQITYGEYKDMSKKAKDENTRAAKELHRKVQL